MLHLIIIPKFEKWVLVNFLGKIAVAVFMAIIFYRLPNLFITIHWGRGCISRAHIRSQPTVCFRIVHFSKLPRYGPL